LNDLKQQNTIPNNNEDGNKADKEEEGKGKDEDKDENENEEEDTEKLLEQIMKQTNFGKFLP
jgi:hypothetical protein